VFEVPTGVVADVWGRRASFLLGTVTLAVTALAVPFLYRSRRQNVRADIPDVVVRADDTTTDPALSDLAA
jgi:hypothetical protein